GGGGGGGGAGGSGRGRNEVARRGWLGQCSPTTSARKPGRRCACSRSAGQRAIAPTQSRYCARADGTSPFQPWLIRKTSVTGSRLTDSTTRRLIRPSGSSVRSRLAAS